MGESDGCFKFASISLEWPLKRILGIKAFFGKLERRREIKLRKYQFLFLLLCCSVTAILFLNFIGIGYLIYLFKPSSAMGSLKGVWQLRNSGKDILKDQRWIDLTMKVTDQFGEPAVNYRLAIIFTYVGWYEGLLPDIAFYRRVRYEVQTDENGEIRLRPFFHRKACDVDFEEIDKEKYLFRYLDNIKVRNIFKNKGGMTLSEIDPEGKGQYVELRVLRHDPPAKSKVYNPKMKIGKDGHLEGFEAKDENVFTLNIEGNELKEGEGEGDIILKIKNLERVCKTYQEREKIRGGTDVNFDERAEWSLTIIGLRNVLIRQKDIEIPTYAPLGEYKRKIIYNLAHCYLFSSWSADKLKKEGWGSIANPELDLPPYASSMEEEEYKVVVGNGIERSFYLKGIEGRDYGILTIWISIDLLKSKFQIRAEGYYNPDGTNNLWKEN